MSLVSKMMKGMNSFTIFDYALYEITVFATALVIAKYYPVLLQGDLWIYLVIIAIGMTHMVDKISRKF